MIDTYKLVVYLIEGTIVEEWERLRAKILMPGFHVFKPSL